MDLFAPASWLAVHIGQHNYPEGLDPLIEHRGIDARDYLAKLRAGMTAEAARLPSHEAYIASLIGTPAAA
jgi:tryptophan halogenase